MSAKTIAKKLIGFLLVIFFAIPLLILGIVGVMSRDEYSNDILFGIIFLVLGAIFLFLGAKLVGKRKEILELAVPQSEQEPNPVQEQEPAPEVRAETQESLVEIKEQERIKAPIANKEKQEKEYIESTIKQHTVFNGGKLIHGGRRNAIVFSRTGEIGIFADGIDGVKIIHSKDVRHVKRMNILH